MLPQTNMTKPFSEKYYDYEKVSFYLTNKIQNLVNLKPFHTRDRSMKIATVRLNVCEKKIVVVTPFVKYSFHLVFIF